MTFLFFMMKRLVLSFQVIMCMPQPCSCIIASVISIINTEHPSPWQFNYLNATAITKKQPLLYLLTYLIYTGNIWYTWKKTKKNFLCSTTVFTKNSYCPWRHAACLCNSKNSKMSHPQQCSVCEWELEDLVETAGPEGVNWFSVERELWSGAAWSVLSSGLQGCQHLSHEPHVETGSCFVQI